MANRKRIEISKACISSMICCVCVWLCVCMSLAVLEREKKRERKVYVFVYTLRTHTSHRINLLRCSNLINWVCAFTWTVFKPYYEHLSGIPFVYLQFFMYGINEIQHTKLFHQTLLTIECTTVQIYVFFFFHVIHYFTSNFVHSQVIFRYATIESFLSYCINCFKLFGNETKIWLLFLFGLHQIICPSAEIWSNWIKNLNFGSNIFGGVELVCKTHLPSVQNKSGENNENDDNYCIAFIKRSGIQWNIAI